jgi:hypothetical protein
MATPAKVQKTCLNVQNIPTKYLCLGRKELLAKRVALMLTTAALWFVQSVHASECVTVTSNNDPSRDGMVCKRVARSSTNGIGFWKCCPSENTTND